MRNIILIGLMFIGTILSAQVDQARIQKDIAIAENLLQTLVEQQTAESRSSWNDEDMVEGSYIDGYGAVFTIRRAQRAFLFENLNDGTGLSFSLPKQLNSSAVVKEKDEEASILEAQEKENIRIAAVEKTKSISVEFFTNYAFLIKSLKADDKIVLNFTDDYEARILSFASIGDRPIAEKQSTILQAETTKQSIDAFRTKKMDKASFVSNIQFAEETTSNTTLADVEVLLSIFQTLYDRSDNFTLVDQGEYNYIPGLGVIVDLKINYGDSKIEGWIERQIERLDNNPSEEEKEDAEELVETFVEDFKENTVEYGRTVQSLQSNEMLIFNIEVFGLSLSVNDKLTLSIKKSVLDSYNEDEISLETAVSKVKTKPSNK